MSSDPLSPYYVPYYARYPSLYPYDPYYRYPALPAGRYWDPVLGRYRYSDPLLEARYWDPVLRRYTYDPLPLPAPPASRYWDPVLLRYRYYDPLLDAPLPLPAPLPAYTTSRDQLPLNSPDRSTTRSYGK